MCTAHRVDQGRIALKGDEHVARQRVPLPVPGQPAHATAETPVARTAGNDHRIELMCPHLATQCAIAALIFGLRELLPDRVAVVGRVAHVCERQRLIKLRSDNIPRLWTDTRRTDVHSGYSLCNLQTLIWRHISPASGCWPSWQAPPLQRDRPGRIWRIRPRSSASAHHQAWPAAPEVRAWPAPSASYRAVSARFRAACLLAPTARSRSGRPRQDNRPRRSKERRAAA